MANKILVIDDTKVDLTEKKSSQANDATQYMTPAQIVSEGGGGSEWTYTEVAVSSAEILALNSTPKTLLVAPGANSYIEIGKVIFEYTHVSTAYTVAGLFIIKDGGGYFQRFITDFTGEGANTIVFINDWNIWGATNHEQGYSILNDSLEFTCQTSDPTLGDGTLLVKIWYKVKTFGTEL